MRHNFIALPAFGLCLLGLASSSALAQYPSDVTRGAAAALGAQGRLLWVDGTANLFRTVKVNGVETQVPYTITREGVADVVRHAKAAHINTLVIDVKPLSGQVLYASKIAPRLREWKGKPVPEFDVLAAFLAEGHKAGLQVDACINVLSEGHKHFSVGLAYQRPEWQSVVYTADRGLFAPNGARLPIRVPREPGDPNAPALLTDTKTLLGDEPNSGMVGLDTHDSKGANEGEQTVGKQLNLTLDEDRHVTGIVDSALLGDDPLSAPEDGHLITLTRESDRTWVGKNIKIGDPVRFDLRISRLPITQAPSETLACFVNPLHPEARKYELDMVREIVSNYDIDGLVLDRCRYSNLYNDFSDRSRDAFDAWLQNEAENHRLNARTPTHIANWPQDILQFAANPGAPPKVGPLYYPWLEFRAQTIRDFVAELARDVRAIKPRLILGTYVGSWYPDYYELGVNWGSEKTSLRYSWFTPNYPRTGYAEFFDWISTGCYYTTATREDAMLAGQSSHATVEFAAELSNVAVAGSAFVYAGVYALDYLGKPEPFLRALTAGARQTQGFMIFDVSQINDYNWWPYLEKAFTTDATPPERMPGLLEALRSVR